MADELTLDDVEIEDVPETEAPEEVATEDAVEPEVTEEAPSAPSIVERYMPGMAAGWDELTDTQKTTLMQDIAEQATARPESAPAEADTSATDRGGESAPGDVAERAAPRIPDALSESDKSALLAFYGEDDPAGLALQKLFDRDDALLLYMSDLSSAVSEDNTRMDGELSAIKQEGRLQSALETHADELGDMGREKFDAIAVAAKGMVADGRVNNYDDAISLAIMETPKAAPSAGNRRRAAQAGSYSTPARRASRARQAVPKDLDEALEQAQDDLRS